MRGSRRWTALAATAAACTIGLTSCSGADYGNGTVGSLTAIGSSTEKASITAWQQGWTKDFPQTSLRYSPDGDATGREALTLGMAHFASLDSQLTAEDWERSKAACGPEGAFAVPTSVTAIGVAYNVAGLRNVKLDQSVLAAIFQGGITKWNDPEIAAINPGVTLRDTKIVPIWVKAQSGLTQAVGEYLQTSAGNAGKSPTGGRWPESTPGESVPAYADVAKKLDDTAGAIAFMDHAAIGTRFSTAALKFSDDFVKASDDALAAAIAGADIGEGPGGGVSLTLQTGSGPGYPLGVVSYQAYCHEYKNPAIARLVKSWATYVLGEGGQANSTFFAQVGSPNSKALAISKAAIARIKAQNNDK
ncbi:substrate-binding domain-containing protein [Arthrobacter sp. CJ23]|uniref:substrate-binding domain-containing protein n=1 Tax=Arthrobacter sp. CJ23 TaxID=2972479 RepID=UPI00215BCBE3|nr:substrate-binding domain-containing protein [Arthrobacter sp. CJ23]UVJ38300.1 substrate-binding domain-containing protein [Arthrobacter sp. CJ23]